MNMQSDDNSHYSAYREWKHWRPEDFGRVDAVQSRYFSLELEKSGYSKLSDLSCLEIGFGNGQFSAWAIAQGMRYSGSEANRELVSMAQSAGIDAIHEADDLAYKFSPGSLDLIVAFDVFEHLDIEALTQLLTSARSMLKNGGRIIARFPSGDSPFSRAIQHGDMTHKSIIGSQMVHQIASACGFDVVQVRPPVFPLAGIGLKRLVRRLPIAVARSLISKAINLIFNDNQPRVLTPNMLVVLEKPSR